MYEVQYIKYEYDNLIWYEYISKGFVKSSQNNVGMSEGFLKHHWGFGIMCQEVFVLGSPVLFFYIV